jgi:hypothetical protein
MATLPFTDGWYVGTLHGVRWICCREPGEAYDAWLRRVHAMGDAFRRLSRWYADRPGLKKDGSNG